MSSANKLNVLLLLTALLTLGVIVTAASAVRFAFFKGPVDPNYQIIQCGGAAGVVHKCIRIEPTAGEINDSATGASYRVIYGH